VRILNALSQDDSTSGNYFSLTSNSSDLFKVTFHTGRRLVQELAAILRTNLILVFSHPGLILIPSCCH